MCAQERGLGRGLDSLFRNAGEAAANKDNTRLPIASLTPGASQPRTYFDDEALTDLANSIRSQGIIQPILVRPKAGAVPQQYEIIAGERRWRAAKKAGITEVPVIIKNLSDEDVLTVALIENIQREDLNAVEEALAIEKLRQTLNIGQEELAKRLGKSRSAIANALRLLQLPSAMLDSLSQGAISAGHARSLLALDDEQTQQALHALIVERGLSVRDVEAAVTHWKRHKSLPESLQTGNEAAPSPSSATPKQQVGKTASRAKAPVIMALQKHLRKQIHPKTTLNGSMEMGRITLPYESADQLATLLTQLGVSLDDISTGAGKHRA